MTGEGPHGRHDDRVRRSEDPPPSRDEILAMMNQRLEIVTAILAGVDRRSELITVVAGASDDDAARQAVMGLLGVTETGAAAILGMQVRRFSAQERQRIQLERSEIEAECRRLES